MRLLFLFLFSEEEAGEEVLEKGKREEVEAGKRELEEAARRELRETALEALKFAFQVLRAGLPDILVPACQIF